MRIIDEQEYERWLFLFENAFKRFKDIKLWTERFVSKADCVRVANYLRQRKYKCEVKTLDHLGEDQCMIIVYRKIEENGC